MRFVAFCAAASTCVVAVCAAPPPARAGNDPSGVVVLVNEASPDSRAVGAHYAEKRSIPERQVVRLRVPPKAELALAEFRALVEEPLRAHLLREGLEERARCLVLTRGIPVRVRLGEGCVSTAALLQCMDLPFAGTPQSGFPGTPLDSLRAGERANPFRQGPFPEDRRPGGMALRLVTSLDGWSAGDANALVDRSVAADTDPPKDPLFLFQEAGGGAAGRNADYAAGAEATRKADGRAETLPAGKDAVRDRRDLLGWMSGGAYSALDDEGVLSNRFAPGALVDMLESFGAVPENFDEKGKRQQFPVPLMVRAGASGVHGAVAEPYAHTFPDTRLFARYLSGLDLAESFHGSLPYLHWMNLVLGDPLCAPFARRPRVVIDGVPSRIQGPMEVRLQALARPGGEVPVSVSLFADGVPVGTVAGAAGMVAFDPSPFPDGPITLLAVARCEGPTRTRGWSAATAQVALSRPRAIRREPALGALAAPPGGPFVLLYDGTPKPPPEILLVDRDGVSVAGTGTSDPRARRVVFTPKAPLAPGRAYTMRIRGIDDAEPTGFTVGATALEATGPKEVRAGAPLPLRVASAGLDAVVSTALAGERIEVRLEDPPVLLASVDVPADAEGPREIPLVLTKAGKATLHLLGRRSGARGDFTIEVKPGPAASLFLLMGPETPVGEAFDIEVRARDACGNAVSDWTGTIALKAPGDPAATVPSPIAVRPFDRGRALFRGVAFGTPGRRELVALGDPGDLLGSDDTMAVATTVRRWLVAGPYDEKTAPPGEGSLRPAPGAVLADRPWRAVAAKSPAVDPGKEKGVLVAVAFVSLPKEAEVYLHLGHGGAMKAWFAGKPIYDGPAAPKAAEERGKVRLKVPPGPAALVLRLECRGGEDAFAARFSLPDGSPVPGLLVLKDRPFPPETLSIAGFVMDAKGPVAGAEVSLSGPKSRKTKTDARGWYGFGDLKPGTYKVVPRFASRKADPEARTVELKDAEATGVDFSVK